MCLSTLHDSKVPKWGVGYKVFSHNMKSPVYTSEKTYCIGKTYDDISRRIIGTTRDQSCYMTGYHFFNHLECAKAYAHTNYDNIVKVRFSQVTATGTDYMSRNIIVARRITLLIKV